MSNTKSINMASGFMSSLLIGGVVSLGIASQPQIKDSLESMLHNTSSAIERTVGDYSARIGNKFEDTVGEYWSSNSQKIAKLKEIPVSGSYGGISLAKGSTYEDMISEVVPKYSNDYFKYLNLEDVMFGIMHTESRGRQYAKSNVGAAGIFQLMPDVRNEYGLAKEDTYNRIAQTIFGLKHLEHGYRFIKPHLKESFGDVLNSDEIDYITEIFAITTYNNGMGNARGAIQEAKGRYTRQEIMDIGLNRFASNVIDGSSNKRLGSESTNYSLLVVDAMKSES